MSKLLIVASIRAATRIEDRSQKHLGSSRRTIFFYADLSNIKGLVYLKGTSLSTKDRWIKLDNKNGMRRTQKSLKKHLKNITAKILNGVLDQGNLQTGSNPKGKKKNPTRNWFTDCFINSKSLLDCISILMYNKRANTKDDR